MNRMFKRFVATQPPELIIHGCRLLDYASPQTHVSISRPKFILTAHAGQRYDNFIKHQDREELLTIVSLLSRKYKNAPPQWPNLRSRLRLSANTEFPKVTADQFDVPQEHIDIWVKCIEAANLKDALNIMDSYASIPWPAFVLLYTFGRHGQSPIVVYNAVRKYQELIPQIPDHMKLEFCVLLLKLTQEHLLDLVPVVVESLLQSLSKKITPAIINELLWQIARYGKRWAVVDISLLSEAQGMVMKAAGAEFIDAKGVFAMAYVIHFKNPQLARNYMDELTLAVRHRTPQENSREFAYTCGPVIIKLLTSRNAEEALQVLGHIEHHKPAVWTCAALYLARNHLLDPELALRLWQRVLQLRIRPTNLLAEIVISSLTSFATKMRVLSQALAAGMKLTPSLVSKMAVVTTKADLEQVQSSFAEHMSHPLVQEKILMSQQKCDPTQMWDSYVRLYKDRLPTRKALRLICRAAWDSNLVWDGLFASQRALAEFKMHVRGASAPADDLLRMYPDEQLVYTYIVMAGRSGYNDELIYFLQWAHDIGFVPSKRVLLALIHYSPQGPALLKMAQTSRTPESQWPTEEEYEVYTKML